MVVERIKTVLEEANKIRLESREIPRVRTSMRWSEGDDDDRPRFATTQSDEDIARANALLLSTLSKYSPPRSPTVEHAKKLVESHGLSNDYARQQLIGLLKALLFEYESGSLTGIEELVHADLFTDFLAMARQLLDRGFKDPAAVMAAGVFEQHIRRLAEKCDVPLTRDDKERTAQAINEDLMKAGAYGSDVQKQVTANLALRNHAAHGQWDKYEAPQVAALIDSVTYFVGRYPA